MAVKTKGKSLKELREEKGRIAKEMQTHIDANEESWTDECEAKHTEMHSDLSDLTKVITRRESIDAFTTGATQSRNPLPVEHSLATPGSPADIAARKIMVRNYEREAGSGRGCYAEAQVGERGSAEYAAAFDRFLRHGANGLNTEQFALLQSDDAQSAGYLTVGEEFAAGLLKDIDDYLYIRRYATVHTVREAGKLGIRKRSQRLSSASWGAELTKPILDNSLKFGKKVLTPHYITQGIAASRDLIRRSVMSIDQIIREELARDAAELQEDGFLFGDGAEKPLGLFVPSADGISTARDVVCGTTTAITTDGLYDTKYSLKLAYREQQEGSVRWLWHRDAVKQIAKLKTSEGQYLWQPGLQAGQPDRLLNYPIDESERTPNTFTTGNYVGLLGNYRYYEIADALDMDMQILDQSPYAEQNMIAYINRMKTDGMPTLEEAFSRCKLA